ncbi:hypothetical protein J3R30DRAFT_650804 [Lentinula aciculospora]|uniref:Uncharacterized protein n=1 Tax=Lentinula aciculospora TaxID=153920 RepID=A0A9W9DK37_9AGAR|nr:hypothetical protein J3R30DRAFT_650804 [Lentinula aciculospora]
MNVEMPMVTSTSTIPLPQELSDRISVEIYELIIPFLSHSPTLMACSLVSRACLRVSWKTLFHQHTVRVNPQNLAAFLELIDLNTCSMTIISFIQRLHFRQCISVEARSLPATTGVWEEDDNSSPFLFDEYFHRFVGLTAVRTLKLSWVLKSTDALIIAALRNNFSGVTALYLDPMLSSSVKHFCNILGAFPLLSSLSLCSVNLSRELDDWTKLDLSTRETYLKCSPPPPLLSNLRELNVDSISMVFLFSWMTHHNRPLPIQSLSVECLYNQSCNVALSKFLPISSSTLQELTIREGSVSTNLDLSSCANLRALEIAGVYLHKSTGVGSVQFITNILRTVTSECLEEIRFTLTMRSSRDALASIEAFDWKGLGSIIGQRQYKDLDRIQIRTSNYKEEVEQTIFKHFMGVKTAKGSTLDRIFHVLSVE